MKSFIDYWFAPTIFADDEEISRHASLLRLTLVTCLVYIGFLGPVYFLSGRIPAAMFPLNVFIVALLLLLVICLRQGRVRLAGYGMLALLFVGITLAVIFQGTIRTPATALYVLVVILAGGLFHGKGVFVSVIASMLVVAGLIVAENADWLPQPNYAVSAIQWLAYAGLFALSGGISFYTNKITRDLLWRAKVEIAERQRAERSFRESEANFRTFFETITDMVVVGTLDGRILYANPAVSRILGYSAADLERLHVLDLNPADQRAEAEEIIAAMFRGERDYCPLPVARKDGSLLPAETRVWLGHWNGQECIYGIIKDLSVEQEAQQRFERMFRHNPAMMALTTLPDRRFVDVNHAFLRVTGYTRSEIIGATSAGLNLMVQLERYNAVAQQLQAGGLAAPIEAQIRCKDGAIRDGLLWGELIYSQGQAHLLTLMIDVTERNLLQAALRQSEADLRRAQAISHLGSYVINLDTWQASWSDELPAIFGCTPEEFSYPYLLSVIHPDDRTVIQEHQKHLAEQTARQFEMEYRLARPDGTVCYVRDVGEVTGAEQGKPRLVFGVIQDVTGQKYAEEKLRESEETYRALFEFTNDGILLYDLYYTILRANPSCAAIVGLDSPDELVGRKIFDFMPPDQSEDAKMRLTQLRSGQPVTPYERTVCRKDGSLVDTELSLSVIHDRAGRPKYIQSVVRDISHRKASEAALKSANEELRLRVEEIEKLQAELREQSLRDPLTGLYNRRFLDCTLGGEILRAERGHTPLSIMVADIDHFKHINDAYGHQAGDQFLIQIANLLTRSTRGSDFVCRYGGEEFLLVLPGTSAEAARQRADEIRLKCTELVFQEGGEDLAISMSVGVATYPVHGWKAEEIITKADKAMYQSKAAGRNRVTVWREADAGIE